MKGEDMCLEYVGEPKEKSGIGYKIVRSGNIPGTYRPYWKYFALDKRGGISEESFIRRGGHPANEEYIIGEVTTITHKRTAKTSKGDSYRAGIHLYKDLWHVPRPGYCTIECAYFDAIAEDDETVVARSIKPLREVL